MFSRGNLLSFCGLCGVFLFSFLLFTSCNLMFFWLLVELVSLCCIPCFFGSAASTSVTSLFGYLVANSISSSCILLGMYSDLVFFLYLGFLIKFGVFPFWGWLYKTVLGSPWLMVWLLSSILKLAVFFLCYFLSSKFSILYDILIGLSFVGLGVMFWVYNHSWRHSWCHMMLSSGYVLFLSAFYLSISCVFILFLVYFFWCSLLLLYLTSFEGGDLVLIRSPLSYYFFCWLVISFPFSFSIFYKLILGMCAFSMGFLIFLGWAVYSILEQAYLLKLISSIHVGGSMQNLLKII